MKKEYLFDKLSELKEKFQSLFHHKKKIAALQNFAEVEGREQDNFVLLIKACMHEGFLNEPESNFLDHILTKRNCKYLDWFHRTKWVKNKIQERRMARQPFGFWQEAPKQSPVYVPIDMLARAANESRGARL